MATSTPVASSIDPKRAANAGTLAALVMLAVQLFWRLGWGTDPLIPALPESVVAASSRLTPLSIFGAATENYGSLAKKTLFVLVLLGIVAVGRLGGIIAGRLAGRWGATFARRLAAGLVVAGSLMAVVLTVIMPIAHLGLFARDASHTREILIQLISTSALYALIWAAATTPASQPASAGAGDLMDRRDLLGQAALGGATFAAFLALGAATWRLLNPRSASSSLSGETAQQRASDIVATQRARQGNPLPTPTSTAGSQVADSAMLTADFALEVDDPLALFLDLEAQDRLTPVLTATPDFYHVSKNIADPTVSADGWKLTITGLVDKELQFTRDQLVERATTFKITTLCCISNELNGSLISTAEWQGVPLADLLNEAGVKPETVDLRFHAADDYEDSVPIQRGLDPDNLVVIGMNGEPLPDQHGFPARLIIPNIYGMKNVKWIDKIEAIDYDFMGYWESRGWSDVAICNVWARIDYPKRKDDLEPGQQTISGVASAGDRSISRVEVSLDDGKSWADALLEPSLNPPFTWVRWAFPFDAQSGEHKVKIRATDGEGNVASPKDRDPLPAGATGWPSRTVTVKG